MDLQKKSQILQYTWCLHIIHHDNIHKTETLTASFQLTVKLIINSLPILLHQIT